MKRLGLASAPLEPYRQAAARGVLALPYCERCAAWQWPPRAVCSRCPEPPGWRLASGNGRIATWSVVARAPRAELQRDAPYIVAFIDLDEGVRMFSRITATDRSEVRAGARVRCVFEAWSDPAVPLPVFVIAEG
ncbi:MAG: OB-fold domain-containing protein [Pigmentiphaga sp.]|uniref:Zn-ribbon domain-containing OB-fold protein n=1 Tax=Pigmentiphaga sp. TaxID=1977564 RepID=UPI0029A5F39B|nr:OB-fold domain-containing protein [Pigmentiphaga sp.]MDX3906601.1 OB-fold domain-containing protein [Pigmentiphaga sp.]